LREIRQKLYEKHGKRTLSKHTLQNSIYQLRNELENRGFSRDLIQCLQPLGYRFALRRAAAINRANGEEGTAGRDAIGSDPQ
jgi:DNA-binding winged helix-turn-helix (wHTH) protein